MNKAGPTLLWFRQDLRLEDHPALWAAARRGSAVYPIYIDTREEEGAWAPGEASRAWLHQSLKRLSKSLKKKKLSLVTRRGPTLPALLKLIRETGADAVYWNRCYEPSQRALEDAVEKAIIKHGVEVETFNASLMVEPLEMRTGAGRPYQVFTPFWKKLLDRNEIPTPRGMPRNILAGSKKLSSEEMTTLSHVHRTPWAQRVLSYWDPGEAGAKRRLKKFLKNELQNYPEYRDYPDKEGTSLLSPHLHFGEISPRRIWYEVRKHSAKSRSVRLKKSAMAFLRQLAWREFAYHILFHFPHTTDRPLNTSLKGFRWRRSGEDLKAWQKGLTGYPIVDAGMRQLWQTGYMHNRVRMIVASFLIKDLLIPWKEGARWFWDTLVDADLANNTLGWQWVAGCGADAAPFFRIFNPVTQGKKFDPYGEYIRRWVPELAVLRPPWIFEPWRAPREALAEAGLSLGRDYPEPIVDHALARTQVLSELERIKKRGG